MAIIGNENSDNSSIFFKKEAVVTDNIEYGKEKVENSCSQPALVIQPKLYYYYLYFLLTRSVITDRELIDIIDSGTEALLTRIAYVENMQQ